MFSKPETSAFHSCSFHTYMAGSGLASECKSVFTVLYLNDALLGPCQEKPWNRHETQAVYFTRATEDEMRTLLKQRISKDHKRSKNYPKSQFRSISSMRRGSNPTGHVMLFKQTCDRLRLLWCIWFGVLCGCGVPYKCLSSSSLRWHQVRQWLSDLSLRQRLHWQVHLWVA